MHFGKLHNGARLAYCILDRRNKSESVGEALPQMKNPYDVLRMKEQELLRVRKEMDALRIAALLMDADDSGAARADPQSKPRRVDMP
jgi:hypothetical protein